MGDIVRAKEIGRKGRHNCIWTKCPKCGKERWVVLCKGKPIYTECQKCASKNRPKTFDKTEWARQYHIRNRKKHNKRRRERYRENREKELEYSKQWKEKYSKEVYQYCNNYKLSKGCQICGYNKYSEALDFHHKGNKEFCISLGVQGSKNLNTIKKEIEKCVVLCANCHRELHAKEKRVEKNTTKSTRFKTPKSSN